MRDELQRWLNEFPIERAKGKSAFTGSPLVDFITNDLPGTLRKALPTLSERYRIVGSAGKGQWTHTPWLAVLDPAVTTTVQEGFYVVYLMSEDGERLYLSLNQGCTRLYNILGTGPSSRELRVRADLMRQRIEDKAKRLQHTPIDLGTSLWRATLYEAGDILNVAYAGSSLPNEQSLIDDLSEAIALYNHLRNAGGWTAEDKILEEADTAGKADSLVQAKRYKQHRSIERQSSHSRKVKAALGYRCMGCNRAMSDLYGPVADKVIEAHHLTPLHSLDDGAIVTFNPRKDFAVLCPNCHTIIHRMDDPSDLAGLQALFRPGP